MTQENAQTGGENGVSANDSAVVYSFSHQGGGTSTPYVAATTPELEEPTPPAAEVPAETKPNEEQPAEAQAPAAEVKPTEETAKEPTPAETKAEAKEEQAEEKPAEEAKVDEPKVITDSNFYRAEASTLIQKGELPADFDLTKEDLSSEDVTTAWENHQRANIYGQLTQQFQQQLNQAGLDNPRILKTAFLINNGVSVEQVEYLADYQDLSTKKIEDFDEEASIDYIETYLSDAEIGETIARTTLEEAKENTEMRDKLTKEAQTYFSEKKTAVDNEATRLANDNLKAKQQAELQRTQFIGDILNSKKLNGIDMDPETYQKFSQGIQLKSIPIQTQDGQTVNVTEFDQFKALFNSRLDVQLQLYYNLLSQSSAKGSVATVSTPQVVWSKTPATIDVPKSPKQAETKATTTDTQVKYSAGK